MSSPYAPSAGPPPLYPGHPVALASVDARAAFLVRTYGTLTGAIVAFTLIEVALFSSGLAEPMAKAMLGTS